MKRSIWIFLLAVLLPSVVLGWLALRSAEEQQIILEKRTAELYQKETENAAGAVRSLIDGERRAFNDAVRRLLANKNPREAAQDFSAGLAAAWPRKAVGFALGNTGHLISPSAGSARTNTEAQKFLLENSAFLCSGMPATVYWVSGDDLNKPDVLRKKNAPEMQAATKSPAAPSTPRLTLDAGSPKAVSISLSAPATNANEEARPATEAVPKAPEKPGETRGTTMTGTVGIAKDTKDAPMAPAPAPAPAPAAGLVMPAPNPADSAHAGQVAATPSLTAPAPAAPAPVAAVPFAAAPIPAPAAAPAATPATPPSTNAVSATEAPAASIPATPPAKATASTIPAPAPPRAYSPSRAMVRAKALEPPSDNPKAPSGNADAPKMENRAATSVPGGSGGATPATPMAGELQKEATKSKAMDGSGKASSGKALDKAAETKQRSQPIQPGKKTGAPPGPAPELASDGLAPQSPEPQLAMRNVEPQRLPQGDSNPVLSQIMPSTADFRTLTTGANEGVITRFVQDQLDVIFWVRPAQDPEMIFGCLIESENLADLWPAAFPAIDVSSFRERFAGRGASEFALALLDDKARPVATQPPGEKGRDWKRPFVASEVGEALPHWETALYLQRPEQLRESARSVRRLLTFLIGGALGVIACGGWLVVADARRQLALAQKKTDFVSNVSHELKTPLTSIRMFAELMQRGNPGTVDKHPQYLRIIMVEAERLTRLINNVLDFARIERRQKRFEKKPLDFHEVIGRIWEGQELHLREAGFTTRWEAAPAPYPVIGDEDALAQILVNLLSNAEKYSGERKEAELHSYLDDARVCVSVLDRGTGVPVGEERKIFEAFYRAHDSLSSGIQGSGLGLTLAQRLAREHGGEILYQAREGGGSNFTLRIPLSPPAPAPLPTL